MSIETVLNKINDIEDWQEELYIELHQNPELSMQETETAATITKRLQQFGYEVEQIGGGVVGVLRNGEGPTVLYRADIDALPVKEATGLPYASTKTMIDRQGNEVPVMHACGHDLHIVAGLGAAALLADSRDEWSGTYIALFQPAEETAEGARSMVNDGLVDRIPKPDVALSQHVLTKPEAGKVGTTAGPVLSTAASMRITVYGKGSHGSMPHLGIDPIVLASSIVLRLQPIISREVNPFEMAVVTVGSIHSGTKANIIPAEAELQLNIRAYSEQVRDQIIAAIKRVVNAECEASNATAPAKIEVFDEYPLTNNDPEVNERVTAAMIKYLGADRVEKLDPVTASEDFSIVPTAFGVPYTYWGFGGFTPDQQVFPNHNPAFGPAMQPTLRTGTEAATVAVLSYLAK